MAHIGGFNPMILTETNITDKAYCRHKMGYNVVCLEAHMTVDGDAQGGLGMIVRNRPQDWGIEKTCFCGTDVMSCEVVNGK